MDVIINRFLPKDRAADESAYREACGRLTGRFGIASNLCLFALKLSIGLLSGSISILADALNNLSDAGSAFLMMLGFRWAAQPADPEHPFGHGRIEYLTGLVVSLAILVVGVELLKSSVEKIIHPEPLEITLWTMLALILSILAKLFMARFYTNIGARVASEAIRAVAMDSRNDCITTAVVLLSILVYAWQGVNIDGIAGALVALFILYSGWSAVKETAMPLVGEPPDPQLVSDIKQRVMNTSEIVGVHDLIVHNYGPGRIFVSLHAEISSTMEIMAAHTIIDTLEKDLRKTFNIAVTVHMDPVILDDPELNKLHRLVENMVQAASPLLSMHDFRVTTAAGGGRNLIFDIVVPYKNPLRDEEIRAIIESQIEAMEGNYHAVIQFDHQYY